MASIVEDGILIANQDGGESVAVRTAMANDQGGNTRNIQLVDLVPRGEDWGESTITELRAVGAGEDKGDSLQLESPLTESFILDLTDAQGCFVWAMYDPPLPDTTPLKTVITPIICTKLGVSYYPKALLTPITIQAVRPFEEYSSYEDFIRIYDDGESDWSFFTIAHPVQTFGARYIHFHCRFNQFWGGVMHLYASPSSCMGRPYQVDYMLANGDYGPTEIPIPSSG